MAFKPVAAQSTTVDTPEQLFRALAGRKYPDILAFQQEVLKTYFDAKDKPDVALQMPTGSGKTLVGLMIAEWNLRKHQERVLYLCPTRQLVNQVVHQANEKYGLKVTAFVGKKDNFKPADKTGYLQAERVAVATYSALFNVNPFFTEPSLIVIDDSHAAEKYIADYWSVRVQRSKGEHATLLSQLVGVLSQVLDKSAAARLDGSSKSDYDRSWVDKLSTPDLLKISANLTSVLDLSGKDAGVNLQWRTIRDQLLACHLYFSTDEILIRPILPPTFTHPGFTGARQRVYMSATLGNGGDLERISGRRSVFRLPASEERQAHGIGRRFFIFPSMSLPGSDIAKLRRDLMERAGRSVVLTTSDTAAESVTKEVRAGLNYPVFDASAIEDSKDTFTSVPKAVAVIANRYDGIDFPGDECRLLFIDGFPRAMNLQERFLMSRMGANALYNERIQTRIIQAVGRCTRSMLDYSAIVVSGEPLIDYICSPNSRRRLHPELQAELKFGQEQSLDQTTAGMLDNCDMFLKQDAAWQGANAGIAGIRAMLNQEPLPGMTDLAAVVKTEVEYMERMWGGDYEGALESAEHVIGLLKEPTLRGYRALWHYLAGSAAFIAHANGAAGLDVKARDQFKLSGDACLSLSWLQQIAKAQTNNTPDSVDTVFLWQLERIEMLFEKLGVAHDRRFSEREAQILAGLESKESKVFEMAHRSLGEMLGYEAGKVEEDGSPDPWWMINDDLCMVFEDHSGGSAENSLPASKARQAFSHPFWIKQYSGVSPKKMISVLVTPNTSANVGAVPLLNEFKLWPLDDFKAYAKRALTTLRNIYSTFTEPGDPHWRDAAITKLTDAKLDASSLYKYLESKPASLGLEAKQPK